MIQCKLFNSALSMMLLLTASHTFAAKHPKEPPHDCDRRVLEKTERNLSHLKSKDVEQFLMTFDSNCTHHDDFHDWGNVLLFQVLQRKPALFVQHLETIPNGKRRAILEELEKPLHNGLNVTAIKHKVEKIKKHDRTRDAVLYALTEAERHR